MSYSLPREFSPGQFEKYILDRIEGDEVFNVMDFGAVGDGQKDDKDAITAADTAADAAGGGVVWFPAGKTFLIRATGGTSQFTVNSRVRWVGNGGTIKLHPSSSTGNTIVTLAGNDCSVEGLIFDGNSISETYGVAFGVSSQRNKIRGCKFTGMTIGALVNVSGVNDITVDHNFFDCNLGGYGFLCNFISGSPTGGRWRICDNICKGPNDGTGGEGIEINAPATGASASDILISGNLVYDFDNTELTGLGIGVAHGQNIQIVNNVVLSCGLSGIHVEDGSQQVLISANVLRDCWGPGIDVQPGAGNGACEEFVISNNIVTTCGNGENASTTAGIRVTSAGVLAKGFLITGNRVDSCGTAGAAASHGIFVYSCDNLIVSNNIVSNTVAATSRPGISNYGDYSAGANNLIVGNRVYGCTRGLNFNGAHSVTYVRDNDLTGNTSGPVFSSATGTVFFDRNIAYDQTLSAVAISANTATPNALNSRYFTIAGAAANTAAWNLANPTTDPLTTGTQITFDIKNSTGGTLGAITWGNKYLLAGSFTNPANSKRRTISFVWDGTNYVETNRAAADI